MSKDAQQLVWFITGTSSGFGRELVKSAVARGDLVVATARSLEKIQDFEGLSNVRTLQLDVTEGLSSIKAKVNQAIGYFGRIDVLVNNAGQGFKTILEEGGSDVLRKQFDVNFFGLMDVTNAVLPHMRSVRSGTVVHIGSRSNWCPEIPGIGAYASSKAAVRVYAETLNAEISPFGIRSLIVEPGAFRTHSMDAQWSAGTRIPDYDEMRDAAKARLAMVEKAFRGDPSKAMELLVDVVRGEGKAAGRPWQLYLPIGGAATDAISVKAAKMIEVVDEWRDVVASGLDME
ncbi:NAD-P-binding protein [Cubamyces sp. BRFM 1775]|nr:NAD-P-binding protein [Cubamyces sp. BRFM 1775]